MKQTTTSENTSSTSCICRDCRNYAQEESYYGRQISTTTIPSSWASLLRALVLDDASFGGSSCCPLSSWSSTLAGGIIMITTHSLTASIIGGE